MRNWEGVIGKANGLKASTNLLVVQRGDIRQIQL